MSIETIHGPLGRERFSMGGGYDTGAKAPSPEDWEELKERIIAWDSGSKNELSGGTTENGESSVDRLDAATPILSAMDVTVDTVPAAGTPTSEIDPSPTNLNEDTTGTEDHLESLPSNPEGTKPVGIIEILEEILATNSLAKTAAQHRQESLNPEDLTLAA